MIIIEVSKRGIQKTLLRHATEQEEAEDFVAYQLIKPRLMAMHAVIKDHFAKEKVDDK